MNTEKMLVLADLLDNLKPVNFNMSDWYSTVASSHYDENYGNDPNDHAELEFSTNNYQVMNGYDCNSAACIAGWAVVLKNDFALEREDKVTVTSYGNAVDPDSPDYGNNLPILIEACDYLDLTKHEGMDLFTHKGHGSIWDRYADELGLNETDSYNWYDSVDLDTVTPKIAAKLIRMIVNGEAKLNGD